MTDERKCSWGRGAGGGGWFGSYVRDFYIPFHIKQRGLKSRFYKMESLESRTVDFHLVSNRSGLKGYSQRHIVLCLYFNSRVLKEYVVGVRRRPRGGEGRTETSQGNTSNNTERTNRSQTQKFGRSKTTQTVQPLEQGGRCY